MEYREELKKIMIELQDSSVDACREYDLRTRIWDIASNADTEEDARLIRVLSQSEIGSRGWNEFKDKLGL